MITFKQFIRESWKRPSANYNKATNAPSEYEEITSVNQRPADAERIFPDGSSKPFNNKRKFANAIRTGRETIVPAYKWRQNHGNRSVGSDAGTDRPAMDYLKLDPKKRARVERGAAKGKPTEMPIAIKTPKGDRNVSGNTRTLYNVVRNRPVHVLSIKEDVYRVDAVPHKFQRKSRLRRYAHNRSWTKSGQIKKGQRVPKGQKVSTGLYTATKEGSAMYGAGRDTSFIQHKDESGQSHVYYNLADRKRIQKQRPVVSSFPEDRFKKQKASGENFSENPGKPTKTRRVRATNWIRKQGHIIHWERSLEKKAKELEGQGIKYNAERTDSWK